MKRTIASVAALILAASPALAGDRSKSTEKLRTQPAAASKTIATFDNGNGDGSVRLSVDGYGSFGSTTPVGDVSYDPAGEIGPSGAVWESAIFFGPFGNFLSTGDFHTGAALPAVKLKKISSSTYVSQFKLGEFKFTLTQTLQQPTKTGSTFTQEYEIENTSSKDKNVVIGRYMEGDLYFVGSFGNDFGGVSADGQTLYQFDEGDDPKTPTTFVGITGTGGQSAGFTIQPYRFSSAIIDAGGLPAALNGKVYNDSDGDGVSNSGFDAGLYKQNAMTIPAKGKAVYRTSTIFGDGSISSTTSEVPGCVKFTSLPLTGRTVTLIQKGVSDQKTTTDAGGCYRFGGLAKGKPFEVVISGPKRPQ